MTDTQPPKPTPELLPCPFCGGKADIEPDMLINAIAYKVECYDCGIQTMSQQEVAYPKAQWNTRALSPKAAPNLEEIKREALAIIDRAIELEKGFDTTIVFEVDELKTIREAILASQPAQPREAGAVNGRKLVPIEPTDCMAVAGSRASEGKDEVRPSVARDIYKAMLAAAPPVESGDAWRDPDTAPLDQWVLIDVSGEVVRAIKKGGYYGPEYWYPHDPEGRSRFTWAMDMVTGWQPLPPAPKEPSGKDAG